MGMEAWNFITFIEDDRNWVTTFYIPNKAHAKYSYLNYEWVDERQTGRLIQAVQNSLLSEYLCTALEEYFCRHKSSRQLTTANF